MIKKKDLPECSIFLVAAIKRLRQKNKSLKQGTCAGLAVYKLFGIAKDLYEEKEIYAVLNALIKDKTIGITARQWLRTKHNNDGEYDYDSASDVKVDPLPTLLTDRHERKYRGFCLDADGIAIEEKKMTGNKYFSVDRLQVYILKDGLPKIPRKLFSPAPSIADEIIASLQKPKKK